MNILEWIVPREKRFFRMLAEESGNITKGTQELRHAFNNGSLPPQARKLKIIESDGDDIVHRIFEELNNTFITPIDREDISSLAMLMDDVLDYSYEAAAYAELYGIKEVPPHMARLSELIWRASREMDYAVKAMERMRSDYIHSKIIKINELESVSEEVLRHGLKDLFNKKDAVDVIKLKDVYNSLEHSMDRCEDVSHVLGDIVMKHR